MQSSMKSSILSDPFQCILLSDFYNLNGVLDVPYECDKIWKFQKQFYYLQTNTVSARRNVTNVSRNQFRYVIVKKKTMSIECQRMWHQGGF